MIGDLADTGEVSKSKWVAACLDADGFVLDYRFTLAEPNRVAALYQQLIDSL
jgi:hypothetical protein